MIRTVGFGRTYLSDDHRMKFDLYCALNRPGADWFSAQLFRLIHKADAHNKLLLAEGFPEHVRVHEEWYNCPDEKEFFREVALSEAVE